MTERLIGGASPFGYFVVVPEAELAREGQRIRSVLSARTYGEARKYDAPGADDDQFGDADPYDVREGGLMDDGDWPPNAGMLALAALPDDVKALAATEESMVGQEWVEFDLQKADEIVATLESMGYAVRRDDAAIQAFDELGNS
jgi:hypothetical protein